MSEGTTEAIPPRQTRWVKYVTALKPGMWDVTHWRDEVQAREIARYLRKRYGLKCHVRGSDVYAQRVE